MQTLDLELRCADLLGTTYTGEARNFEIVCQPEDFQLRPTDFVAYRSSTGLVVRQEFLSSKAVLGGCVNALVQLGESSLHV